MLVVWTIFLSYCSCVGIVNVFIMLTNRKILYITVWWTRLGFWNACDPWVYVGGMNNILVLLFLCWYCESIYDDDKQIDIIHNCCTFHLMGVPYYTMIQSHKMGVLDSLHQASKNVKAKYTITNTSFTNTLPLQTNKNITSTTITYIVNVWPYTPSTILLEKQ
jgi:hypothetical protein